MTSEDGDISALLSEPSPPEEQPEASGFDDFLPTILEAIKSNEKAVQLSPEETAWADSCFVQTSELTDVNWEAMRKALVNSLEKPIERSHGTNEVVNERGTQVIAEAKPHHVHVENDTQYDDVNMVQRDNDEDSKDSTEVFGLADVIRSADGHAKQTDGYTTKQEGDDELAATEIVEQADRSDPVFKVWDLGVSFADDEDELELVKDLKKILRDDTTEAAYPYPSDRDKTLGQVDIDELTVVLGDLSLQKTDE